MLKCDVKVVTIMNGFIRYIGNVYVLKSWFYRFVDGLLLIWFVLIFKGFLLQNEYMEPIDLRHQLISVQKS